MKAVSLPRVRLVCTLAVAMPLALFQGTSSGADSGEQPEKPAAKQDVEAAGEEFPFGKPPFRSRLFTQQGGDNLLPAIKKETAGKWGLGKDSVHRGLRWIELSAAGPQKRGRSARRENRCDPGTPLYLGVRVQVFRRRPLQLGRGKSRPGRLGAHAGPSQ